MSEPHTKKTKIVSSLEQLKAMTTIVADTGDFEGNILIGKKILQFCMNFKLHFIFFITISNDNQLQRP